MNETYDCASAGPLLAELALGAAAGHERAHVLRHVAGCAGCRQELSDLAAVADSVLLLVPLRPPPADFGTSTLDRIRGLTGRRDRGPAASFRSARRRLGGVAARLIPARTRLAALAAVVAIAAGAGAAAVWWQTATDRHLADRYRQVTATTNGPRATTAPVTTSTGTKVGYLVVYPGTPPLAILTLTAAPEPGDYTMTVETTDGHHYVAGTCTVTGTTGTATYPLQVPLVRVATIEIARPGVELTVRPG